MLRGILQVLFVLFFLRILFWLLRLISAGARSKPEPPGRTVDGRARRGLRVDRSNVTDVTFTEIPGERADVEREPAQSPLAGADGEPIERAEAR